MIDKRGHICLTNFKFSKENMKKEDKTDERVGTAMYLSPEMIKGEEYGLEVDWWAFGIILFQLINGFHPFFSHDVQNLFHRIVYSQLVVPDVLPYYTHSFLKRLLEKDPNKRITVKKKKIL